MKKAEIWLVDLNPIKGNEQAGLRPVVIVSGNAMNDNMPLSIVCPMSTKIKNFIGDLVLEPNKENGLSAKSEILVFQIRTVSHSRFIKKIGTLREDQMDLLLVNLNKILKY